MDDMWSVMRMFDIEITPHNEVVAGIGVRLTEDLQITSQCLGIGSGIFQPEQRVPEPLRVE
jgi:hypothetical protein